MLAQITKNQLAIRGNTQLVQGTVGETLRLAFSDEWAGLAITAVFAAGEQKREIVHRKGSHQGVSNVHFLIQETARKAYFPSLPQNIGKGIPDAHEVEGKDSCNQG